MIKDITVFRQSLCGGETACVVVVTDAFSTDQHGSPGAALRAVRAPVSASVLHPHEGPHRAPTLKSHQGGQRSFFLPPLSSFSLFLSVPFSIFPSFACLFSIYLSFFLFGTLSHTCFLCLCLSCPCRSRSGAGSNKSAIKARVLWGDSRQ